LTDFSHDERIVLTLDAGGSNFVFSAIQGYKEIVDSVSLPSHGENLKESLKQIITGFETIYANLDSPPVAISFAFPGPADYPAGIIGDLVNLPAYRGGIALGPMLCDHFHLPVYINNDGNLFGLGEAMAGFLPWVNGLMESHLKCYNNLIGVTLGTGFGGSIIHDSHMLIGDNSAAGEIWALRNFLFPDYTAEETVSIRGLKRLYADRKRIPISQTPEPVELYQQACQKSHPDRDLIIESFNDFGRVVGEALAVAVTLVDGLVVIGGGLSNAADLFLSTVVETMNAKIKTPDNRVAQRLEIKCYNLQDDKDRERFLTPFSKTVKIPFSDKEFSFDDHPRIGVGVTKLGTSQAIAVGAYAFALSQLD
jgi:glucokinase